MTPTRSRLITALPVLAVIASIYPALGNDETTAREAPVDVSQPAQSPSAGKAALAPEERQFLEAAAEFNVTGMAMANLASRHANSVAVDTLSQHLRREHSLSLAAVREIARAKGVALAEKRSAAHDASIAALALVTGRAFDEGYRKLVISLQEQAIRSFFAAMRAARDRDIRNSAEQNFGELRLQRAGFGATPVIVQGEVAARLVPPAPLLAFRIPA